MLLWGLKNETKNDAVKVLCFYLYRDGSDCMHIGEAIIGFILNSLFIST